MTKQRSAARSLVIALLCSAISAEGCATSRGLTSAQVRPRQGGTTDNAVLAEYVQRLPPGTALRVERARGPAVRGTLIKATAQSVIVQPRTRVPEPAVEVALSEVLSVIPYSPTGPNIAKAVAIGAAAGAGAALAVFFIIAAVYSD